MPPDMNGLITEKEALSYMVSSVVRETVSAEFKVFREYLETHLEACMGQCKARGMFDTDCKLREYYDLANRCHNHFEKHEESKTMFKWVIGFVGANFAGVVYSILCKVLGW